MSGNIGTGVSKRFRYTELLGNTAFALGILAAGALSFRPAYAQGQTQDESTVSDRAFAIEEITVTAQKRDESLQDVPISISSIGETELEIHGISNVKDIQILTPSFVGIHVGNYFMPRLRGVGTMANASSVENPIATYIDGVYIGSQAASFLSLANVERIEVDKGPQGTLFGRNATGGLIQIITPDPSRELSGKLSVGYGNYDTITSGLYLTGPLSDNLAADISVSFDDQNDGFGTNLFNGKDVDYARHVVARSKWLLNIGDLTKVRMTFDYSHMKGHTTLYPYPGSIPLGYAVDVPLRDLYIAGEQFDRGEGGGISLDVEHEFERVLFKSTSTWRKNSYELNFPQTTPVPELQLFPHIHDKFQQLSQEFQLSSIGDGDLTWVGGIFFYYSSTGWRPIEISGPLIAPLSIIVNDTQKTRSLAGYGQATYAVTPDTRLTLGLRYTGDWKRWEGTQSFEGLPIPPFSDRQKRTDEKLTWRVSLDHRINDDVMVYASMNRGFKSGGFNDSRVPASAYAPETLDAYEVGIKSTLFDSRVRLNGAAYYYDYDNLQVTRIVAGNIEVYNGAKARIYGVDLDAEFVLTQNLRVRAGAGWLHNEYLSFPNADITSQNPLGGTTITTGDAKGNKLSYTPDLTANVSVEYRIPSSVGDINVGANYLYNDGWYATPDNRLRQDAYGVVNASVSWTSPSEQYELRLWAKNITNKNYFAIAAAVEYGDTAFYEPPRTYGATLTMRLGAY